MTANTPDNCYADKSHSAHDLLAPGESCKACGFINPPVFMVGYGFPDDPVPPTPPEPTPQVIERGGTAATPEGK